MDAGVVLGLLVVVVLVVWETRATEKNSKRTRQSILGIMIFWAGKYNLKFSSLSCRIVIVFRCKINNGRWKSFFMTGNKIADVIITPVAG